MWLYIGYRYRYSYIKGQFRMFRVGRMFSEHHAT